MRTQIHQNLKNLIYSYKKNIDLKKFPKNVRIVEVGARDGLQNEPKILHTDFKIQMINSLSKTGLDYIETTAFVSPKWVPQMADNYEVLTKINREPHITYSALVPNMKGMETAKKANCKEIAIFTAASEEFTKKNINCSIDESFERFKPIVKDALQNNIKVRGYVSCVMGCPYKGTVDPKDVDIISNRLIEMGCYEVSLGDTIGVGTPELTHSLQSSMTVDKSKLAVHFHDTGSRAIENILIALQYGIGIVDSSVGGLGGCPYAKTTAGNVCSENVVLVLHELGISTGIDLDKQSKIGELVCEELGRENSSIYQIY